MEPQPLGGILQRLVDVLGAEEGADLFNGPAIPPPNEQGLAQITVITYGGSAPGGTHNEGLSVLRRSTFQVIGRHEDYDVAYAAAEAAREALIVTDIELRGLYFLRISPRTELADLPLDPQRRVRVAFSVEAVSRLIPAGASLKGRPGQALPGPPAGAEAGNAPQASEHGAGGAALPGPGLSLGAEGPAAPGPAGLAPAEAAPADLQRVADIQLEPVEETQR